MGDINDFNLSEVHSHLNNCSQPPELIRVCAGPPCPDFSRIRANAPGLLGPQGCLFETFCQVLTQLDTLHQRIAPVSENVYFKNMQEAQLLDKKLKCTHVVCDPADAGFIRRPRLWWTRIDWQQHPHVQWDNYKYAPAVRLPAEWQQHHSTILDINATPHWRIQEGYNLFEVLTTPAPSTDGRPAPIGRQYDQATMQR